MILEWYPISVSEDGYHPRVCSYRAPLSPVARQVPPYTQRRCGRVRSSAFRTLCLYHRSFRNGRWAGKRAGVICGPRLTCYPSVRAPGWCYEAFAVDGELAESFPTYPPTGWWRRTCCCPVPVAWECGAGAGPHGRGHRWRLRALLRAVSNRVEGKITVEVGNGECRSKDNSSVGTVDLTSARRESRRESIKLAKAGTVWLPMNARVFDPEERSLSKLAWVEGWSASRNPETVESHQSTASPRPNRTVSSRRAPCEEGESGVVCGRSIFRVLVMLG